MQPPLRRPGPQPLAHNEQANRKRKLQKPPLQHTTRDGSAIAGQPPCARRRCPRRARTPNPGISLVHEESWHEKVEKGWPIDDIFVTPTGWIGKAGQRVQPSENRW